MTMMRRLRSRTVTPHCGVLHRERWMTVKAQVARAVLALVVALLTLACGSESEPVDSVQLEASITPTGFVDEAVVSGLASPTAMAFAPDGRIFVAEQGGK